MNRKGGLGKGLDALFAGTDMKKSSVYEQQNDEAIILNISEIEPNKNQPRYCFNERSIEALSNSIKENGVIQPIVVRRLENSKFEIVAGERRFRASKLAGLEKIPAIVKNLDEKTSTELALIENLQREDLNPIEEARGFSMLMRSYNLTQEDVAKKVGKSRSAVANSIRILNLPEEILKLVENSSLSEGQARALLAVEDVNLMKELAQKAIELKLSVRELEKLCSAAASKKAKKLKKQAKDDGNSNVHHMYKDLENAIKAEIRRNVKIEVVSGEKGRIVIDFYNREDLVSMAYVLANVKRRY